MKNKMLTIMFIAYLFVFAIGSLIIRDRDFSDMENRNLKQLPEINKESLLNGSYSEEFEEYMSDQIIFKDFLVKLKITTNLAMNQTLINDVYFTRDNMLIQNYRNPYNQLSKNIQFVNEFAEANTNLECTWLVVPNACYVYSDKLNSYQNTFNQGEVLGYITGNVSDCVNLVDCGNELILAKDDYIFYNTDHHWTMNGAYIGYLKVCEALDITPTNKEDFDISVGSNKFYGTLYSKAPSFTQKPDEIILYNNKKGEYKVEYLDEETSSESLYNMDNLCIKDKYTTYLDGNHSIIKITGNAVSGDNGKILIIKDSYAHCLIPFLADNYSEIYVIDLRYYHESVSKLAKEQGIDKVLFINNIDFLSTDNNFLWLY